MSEFDERYSDYLKEINDGLDRLFLSLDENAPTEIREYMKYAVEGGGKRVRPVLFFAVCDALKVDGNKYKELALGIELIHSYSLVHDDLECMDNDDYRRGKLSVHKKYGEANAVLCGDALLNFAFETMLSNKNITPEYINAMRIVGKFAGYSGMVAGQILDLKAETSEQDEKLLWEIFENKTAKLLTAPLICASCLAGKKFYKELFDFGNNIGLLFQITDDIMDVEGSLESIGKTPNKDKAENKLTSVRIFGIDGAKKIAETYYRNALTLSKTLDGSGFLTEFTEKLYARKK